MNLEFCNCLETRTLIQQFCFNLKPRSGKVRRTMQRWHRTVFLDAAWHLCTWAVMDNISLCVQIPERVTACPDYNFVNFTGVVAVNIGYWRAPTRLEFRDPIHLLSSRHLQCWKMLSQVNPHRVGFRPGPRIAYWILKTLIKTLNCRNLMLPRPNDASLPFTTIKLWSRGPLQSLDQSLIVRPAYSNILFKRWNTSNNQSSNKPYKAMSSAPNNIFVWIAHTRRKACWMKQSSFVGRHRLFGLCFTTKSLRLSRRVSMNLSCYMPQNLG